MGKLEIALGIMLSLAVSSVLAAEYYTWVDENGVTNYSERQPPGYTAQHVRNEARFGYRGPEPGQDESSEESADSEDESPANDPGTMSDEEIDKQIANERARMDAQIAKAKASNCMIGKRNLAQLEAYSRVRVKDDDGTERVLTDAEKSNRIAKARQTISENCSG